MVRLEGVRNLLLYYYCVFALDSVNVGVLWVFPLLLLGYNVVTLYFSCVLFIEVVVLRSSQSYLIIGVTVEAKLFGSLNGG